MAMRHLTLEVLLDLLEDRLPAAEREWVMAHLATPCRICQAELEYFRGILRLLRDEQLSEPPAAVVARAARLYKHFPRRPEERRLPRLVASLVFDSRLMPGLMAARGPAKERQVLYHAEGLDIDLQMTSETGEGHVLLMGQVLPTHDGPSQVPGYRVSLLREDEVVASVTADELGAFVLRALPADEYEVWIDLPQAVVWIPCVNVGLSGAA
jgi:hypothetical protein